MPGAGGGHSDPEKHFAIAAVVIGGASLMGGRGTAVNALLGVIGNVMNLLNVPGYNQQVVKGVIILVAAVERFVRFDREILPDLTWQERYEKIGKLFDRLHESSEICWGKFERS